MGSNISNTDTTGPWWAYDEMMEVRNRGTACCQTDTDSITHCCPRKKDKNSHHWSTYSPIHSFYIRRKKVLAVCWLGFRGKIMISNHYKCFSCFVFKGDILWCFPLHVNIVWVPENMFLKLEAGKKILPTILPLFPSVQSLQNVPFLVSVALMQMSCQSEPQHGGEVIAAVWRLQELYIYTTLYYYIIIIILLYKI